MEYSAGMVTRLFWLSETRRTAELLVEGIDKATIKKMAIQDNLFQVKTRERAVRIVGMVLRRLESLPDCLISFICRGDIATAKLLILISIIKTDRLFFEFVYEVHRQAIVIGENIITDRVVNQFFENKIAQSETVAKWTGDSIKKLKQCYIKMLTEGGVLSNVKGERKIIIPPIDYKTRQLLEENKLSVYLNALTGEE